MSTYETPSYKSSKSNFTSLISSIINNNISNNDVNNNNFNNNLTDIINARSNIMDINYNMNIDNIDNMNTVQPTTIISPSNNFLLYYYVEYM